MKSGHLIWLYLELLFTHNYLFKEHYSLISLIIPDTRTQKMSVYFKIYFKMQYYYNYFAS